MRTTVLLILCNLITLHATVFSQSKVTMSGENIPLKNALVQIEKEAQVKFVYRDETISDFKVSFDLKNSTIEETLNVLLKGTGSSYRSLGNNLIVISPVELLQGIAITGTVFDEAGVPMPGVNVVLQGASSTGTVTDVNGKFSINVPGENSTLVFSFIGYVTEEVVLGNQRNVSITLKEDTKLLDEVVVVGYGTQRKVNLTGAVASVGGDVLSDRPISNIGQGLQGVVPNLNVTTGNGLPGKGSEYNIRGYTSLSGGTPLVLVDGVQMDPNLINPQDIASISVLKDAASAAVYGARGAYGVILITTKQGSKSQKPTVTANVNIGFHQPTTIPKTAGSWDYANYMNMVVQNSGWGRDYFDAEYMAAIKKYQDNPIVENAVFQHSQSSDKSKYDYSGDTDWYADIMKKFALNQQYNIGISGGSETTQYYASVGYIKDLGLLDSYPDSYARWNTNLNLKTQVTKWLEVSGKALYNYGFQDLPNTNFKDWGGGLFGGDLRPLMPLYHPDGHYSGQGNWTHPLAVAKLGGFQNQKINDLWLTGAIKATPIEGMTIVSDYTLNYYSSDVLNKTRRFLEYRAVPGTEQYYPWTNPSYVENKTNHDYYYAFNAYIDYEKTFGKHYMKGMIGYNQENKAVRGYGARRPEMINDDIDYIGLATGTITLQNNQSTAWAIQGMVFRVNYTYDNKYLLEVNGRYDASSKFPSGDRSGFFPSVSAGWRISQEHFMEATHKWLSDLKIRASYGSLGNQVISGNFTYYPAMGVNSNYQYLIAQQVTTAISAPRLVSNNFTWEKVTQLDFGLDFAFLKNRLTGTFDWYQRNTTGMMAPSQPFPAQLGASAPNVNAADLKTNGWEISLKWNDRTSNGINYSVGFVMSDNQSEITKYYNPTGTLASGHYVGKKIDEVWGYKTLGKFKDQPDIDNSPSQSALYGGTWYPGDIKFANIDDNDKIDNGKNTIYEPGDRSIIGNTTARYSYGITLGGDFKGFDLDLFMQGVGKRDFFPGGDQFWGLSSEWGVPITWQIGNYWTPETPDAYLPRQSFSNGNKQTQTGYKMNAAYLRLKQLTIGYTLPQSLTEKVNISRLRVYFTGQNLFCFTSLPDQYDPETISIGTYPPQRIYSFGLNLTF